MSILEQKIGIKKLNLDTNVLIDSCYKLNEFTKTLDVKHIDRIGLSDLSDSSSYWRVYNTFLFPYPGFHQLFRSIRDTFFEELGSSKKRYYIQSWLNWYTEGRYIDWHSHSQSPMSEFMTGYYSVSANDSVTTHKINGQIFDVENKDDHIVFTKMNTPSVEIYHRTWPVPKEKVPRITIAFEILTEEGIETHFGGHRTMYNHWIPLI